MAAAVPVRDLLTRASDVDFTKGAAEDKIPARFFKAGMAMNTYLYHLKHRSPPRVALANVVEGLYFQTQTKTGKKFTVNGLTLSNPQGRAWTSVAASAFGTGVYGSDIINKGGGTAKTKDKKEKLGRAIFEPNRIDYDSWGLANITNEQAITLSPRDLRNLNVRVYDWLADPKRGLISDQGIFVYGQDAPEEETQQESPAGQEEEEVEQGGTGGGGEEGPAGRSPSPGSVGGGESSGDPRGEGSSSAREEEEQLEEEFDTFPKQVKRAERVGGGRAQPRALGGLPSMVLGTACKGDLKAPGCYSVAGITDTKCNKKNVKSAACNFKTISVPTEDGDTNKKYAVYNALDMGAKIKLQLQRALIRYGFAAAVIPIHCSRVLDRNFVAVSVPGLFRHGNSTRDLTREPIFVSNAAIARFYSDAGARERLRKEFLVLNIHGDPVSPDGHLNPPMMRLLEDLGGAKIEGIPWAERFYVNPHYSRFVPMKPRVDLETERLFRGPHVAVMDIADGNPELMRPPTDQTPVNVFYEDPASDHNYVPYPIVALSEPAGGTLVTNAAYIEEKYVSPADATRILNRASGMLLSAANHLLSALKLFMEMSGVAAGEGGALEAGVPRGAAPFLTKADVNALKAISSLLGPSYETTKLDLDTFRVVYDQKNVKITNEKDLWLENRVIFTEVLWSYWIENNAIGKLRRRQEFREMLAEPQITVQRMAEVAKEASSDVKARYWYLPEDSEENRAFNARYLAIEFY